MLFYDVDVKFFFRNFNSMLPQVGTQFCHPKQFFQLFVFFLQFFVVNVLFHFGKVSKGSGSFFITPQTPTLIDPVKDGGVALNTIDQLSLSLTEFAIQYFIYNFLLKGFGVE